MLRITTTQTESRMTLKLEGNLSGPWVEELRGYWAKLAQAGVPVEIDLRGLFFLDAGGSSLLRRMEQEGSRLFGSSAFIQALLHTEELVEVTRPRKSSKGEN